MIVFIILGLIIIAFMLLYSLIDIIIDFDDRINSSIRLGIMIFAMLLCLIDWYLGNLIF